MNDLLAYLNDLPPVDRESFARRCGTTEGYLRKAVSTKQKIGESLCINIERETARRITCEYLRPDVDWAYLRATKRAK